MDKYKVETTTKVPPALILFKDGRIKYNYTICIKEVEGRFSVYIPGYNLFLSVSNKEVIKEKARFMVRSFYDFHLKNNGLRNFVLEIHKLGFRSNNHDLIMKNLLNNKKSNNIKFNHSKPQQPVGSETIEMEEELAH